jgi:hypothetical protein
MDESLTHPRASRQNGHHRTVTISGHYLKGGYDVQNEDQDEG